MRRAILTLFVLAAATPARAGYMDKFADWNKLTPVLKYAYAMGVVDGGQSGWMLSNKADEQSIESVNAGRLQCIVDNNLTADLLVKLIDDRYTATPADWPSSPSFILNNALAKMCQPEIRAERAKRGLPPLR